MNIRKGDKVLVISGDDRGAQGEVQRVLRAKWGKGRRAGQRNVNGDRVVVAGVNTGQEAPAPYGQRQHAVRHHRA